MNHANSVSPSSAGATSTLTTSALSAMGDRFVKLAGIVDSLESRLNICLRGQSPASEKTEPQVVPESPLIGALSEANNTLDVLAGRLVSITERVTL